MLIVYALLFIFIMEPRGWIEIFGNIFKYLRERLAKNKNVS